MTRCQFCGGAMGANARFCSSCGKPRSESITAKPAQTESKFGQDFGSLNAGSVGAHGSQHELRSNNKTVRPNVASVEAIRHTLFVLPEHFSESFQSILLTFQIEPAGIIYSSAGACVVDRCQQILRDSSVGKFRYVCIIGNWHEVPPLNVVNDFGMDDGDEYCQSDAFFGSTHPFNSSEPFSAIPEIPVGRIPVADRDIVLRVLGNDPGISPTRNLFQFGVTAKCWEIASKEIVSSFPNMSAGVPHEALPQDIRNLPKSAMICSPEWTEFDFRRAAGSGPSDPFGLMYFNVHGGADEPQWVGEGENGDYVRIFEPSTIEDFKSAILVTEACYGGALSYASPSIVETFFMKGGHSFVGSSTIAYGARATPISAADLIAKHYVLGLYHGLTQGEALKIAKLEALAEDPLSLECGFKTVLSFNLFGAPWQRLVRTSDSSIATSSTSQRPMGSSVLDRVRAGLQKPRTTEGSFVSEIRDKYRSRLPERDRQFLIQSSEILTKLREFKDFSRIMEVVSQSGSSLEDLKLDFVSAGAGSVKGYRLICSVNKSSKRKSTLILITDSLGKLTKTLVSKGSK